MMETDCNKEKYKPLGYTKEKRLINRASKDYVKKCKTFFRYVSQYKTIEKLIAKRYSGIERSHTRQVIIYGLTGVAYQETECTEDFLKKCFNEKYTESLEKSLEEEIS